MEGIYVVGAGRVGFTYWQMLRDSGERMRGLTCRSATRAQALLQDEPTAKAFGYEVGTPLDPLLAEALRSEDKISLFFTCADDVLTQAAEQIAALRPHWQGTQVLHASGGLPLEVFASFEQKGATIASLHPCYPVFQAETRLPADVGVCYTYRGRDTADAAVLRGQLAALVVEWGGEFIEVAEIDAEAYHAAAVLSAGHLTTLLASSTELFEKAGVDAEQAAKLSYSVYSGVIKNIASSSNAEEMGEKITGPFVRGDKEMINRHRAAIKRRLPSILALYDSIGKRAQEIIS